MGTYCGWCVQGERGFATRGTKSGPGRGTTCDAWTWDHGKCPAHAGIDPEQVHLSLAGERGELLAVTWASRAAPKNASLAIEATETSAPIVVPATTSTFTTTNANGAHYVHRAVFSGRAAPTTLRRGFAYKYSVTLCSEDSCIHRGPFAFVYDRETQSNATAPLSLLVYGDLGRFGGGQVLRALKREMVGEGASGVARGPDLIFHIGDYAYDLQSAGGLNGDLFLRRIEALATAVPYMGTPGNHEIQRHGEEHAEYFAHYRSRFTMPRAGRRSDLDMWYSFDVGLVHFVSYSSEVFFSASQTTQQRMLRWLKADLASANTPAARAARPWILPWMRLVC